MAPRIPYENDQWTLELHELGFENTAKELAQMAILCQPPFATCVCGRWGSGKTSIMRYAMTYLGGEMQSVRVPYRVEEATDRNFGGDEDDIKAIQEQGREWMRNNQCVALSHLDEVKSALERNSLSRVSTLWFSPWRFQVESNPMVPLLHSLREQLSQWVRAKASLGKLGKAAVEAGLEVLGNLADMTLAFGGLRGSRFGAMGKAAKQAIDRIETQRFENATDTERFNLLFEYAIKNILGVKFKEPPNGNDTATDGQSVDNDHRLVIFIDDLDRCEGDVPLRLLEAIKLYLSTRYCVFVLGLDVAAIEHSISGHWTHNPLGTAHEYLDKMFQSYVHVPISTDYPRYIHNQLVRWEYLPGAKELPISARATATSDQPRDGEKASAAGQSGAAVEPAEADGEPSGAPVGQTGDTGINSGQPADVARIIADILPPNPRKVKNFLNSLRLAWQVAEQRETPDEQERAKKRPDKLKQDLAGFAIMQRLRARAPRAFLLITQDPGNNLPKFLNFCTDCVNAAPMQSGNDVNEKAVFIHDFRHLVVLDKQWSTDPLKPDHKLRDITVQLDRIKSDRALLKHINDKLDDAERFCRFAGVELAR